jgi:enoyl-CoA hydratase/carnithine racemase
MIELSEQDGIAIVRMADGKANTMSREFCEALTRRFGQAQASSRAVVLTGSGNIFSAGVDLLRLVDGGPAYIRTFLPALNAMFATVFGCEKPVVAAINGHAIAGGCVLACAADHRLMRRDAGLIGVTELLVGVPLPPIAMEIMHSAIAPQFLAEAVYSGTRYAPADALARGLLHALIEPDTLIEQAIACARKLADLPPAAFALTKRQLREGALARVRDAAAIDAAVERIWTSPETIGRIRDYVSRTLRKS